MEYTCVLKIIKERLEINNVLKLPNKRAHKFAQKSLLSLIQSVNNEIVL